MTDEVVDARGLSEIVERAIMDAVHGKAAPAEGGLDAEGEILVMGAGAAAAIRDAALRTATSLAGSSAILSAPLVDAESRLRKALAGAESVAERAGRLRSAVADWRMALEARAKRQEGRDEAPGPAPGAQVEEPAQPAPSDAAPAAPEAPAVLEAKEPEADPETADDQIGPLEACGEPVAFSAKAAPAFKRFMHELVSEMGRGPVSPSAVVLMAERNGYDVNQSTIAAQVESHLGRRLLKWKDDGKRWWGLAGRA